MILPFQPQDPTCGWGTRTARERPSQRPPHTCVLQTPRLFLCVAPGPLPPWTGLMPGLQPPQLLASAPIRWGSGGGVSIVPRCPNSPDGLSSGPFVGICTGLHPRLDLSPREPDVLAPRRGSASLEASPGGAAWPTGPEGDQLLDPLRLGTLPWDQGLLERLSPKLTLGDSFSGAGWPRTFSVIEAEC